MPIKHWTPHEVARIVAASGKPLEVAAAQAFLGRASWSAALGTYFEERNTLKPPRELDVLTTRETSIVGQLGTDLTCRVRGLVSCKGFSPRQQPVAYSVATSSVPGFAPRLLSQHRAQRVPYGESYGRLVDIEAEAATRLLTALGMATSSPLVALDIINDTDQRNQRKLSDKDLFEGVDSALKAAFFWQGARLSEGHFVELFVPALVLLRPWWEVPIDGGDIGIPTESHRGYLTCRYPNPDHGSPREPTVDVTVLLVSRDELDALVDAFDGLFEWLAIKSAALFGQVPPAPGIP